MTISPSYQNNLSISILYENSRSGSIRILTHKSNMLHLYFETWFENHVPFEFDKILLKLRIIKLKMRLVNSRYVNLT